MSALRILSSVHGSLFLRWTFFICTIASSLSHCFRALRLRAVTRSDLRFYLSNEVAHWDEFLFFLFALRVLRRLFVRLWPAVSCFCSLALSPGYSPFLNLFAWLRSILFIGGCRSLPLFCVFSSFSAFLFCLLPFASTVLCRSSLFLHEVLWHFLPWFGFLPSGSLFPRPFVSPHLVPSCFVLPLLISAFSFGLFFVSCASSRLACFALGPFLHLLVPLLISFSTLSVPCTFVWVFLGFLIRLFFGWLSLLSVSLLLYYRVRSFRCLWCSSICVSFLTVPTHQISLSLSFSCFFPLSLSLCVSSFSCLLFSRASFLFFLFGFFLSFSRISFCVLLSLCILSSL